MFIDKFSMPMIKKTINAMDSLGVDKIFRNSYSGIGSIFMMHRIVEHKDSIIRNIGGELCVQDFEHMLDYIISNGFEVISIDEMFEVLKKRKHMENKKFVVLTFDDGYKDFNTLAYPILKQKNLPFTVYITTDIADQRYIFWKYFVRELLVQNDEVVFNDIGINIKYKIKTNEQKESAFKSLRRLMINWSESQKYKFISYVNMQYGIVSSDFMSMGMNREELNLLAKDPLCTIGNHTVSHPRMSGLSDDEFNSQIWKSNEIFKESLGFVPSHFAFPYGSENELNLKEKTKIKEFGFKTSVTTFVGNIFPEHVNYLNSLPRIPINGYLYDEKYMKMLLSGSVGAMMNRFTKIVH